MAAFYARKPLQPAYNQRAHYLPIF